MLIKRFSIGVEQNRVEEVINVIQDNFGIEVIKTEDYTENWLFGNETKLTYIECYCPNARYSILCEYLDDEFTGTAIIE